MAAWASRQPSSHRPPALSWPPEPGQVSPDRSRSSPLAEPPELDPACPRLPWLASPRFASALRRAYPKRSLHCSLSSEPLSAPQSAVSSVQVCLLATQLSAHQAHHLRPLRLCPLFWRPQHQPFSAPAQRRPARLGLAPSSKPARARSHLSPAAALPSWARPPPALAARSAPQFEYPK